MRTIKELSAFLNGLDELGAWDCVDLYTGVNSVISNPEAWKREVSLVETYRFLPKAIKPEFVEACENDITNALMNSNSPGDEDRLWTEWEAKGRYLPTYC